MNRDLVWFVILALDIGFLMGALFASVLMNALGKS